MHRASSHLATAHFALRLSNFPFRHELAGTIGHRLDSAFGSGQVVTTTSDANARGMNVCGMGGHKSTGTCSHGGCTE
jgi:hypothetical protein